MLRAVAGRSDMAGMAFSSPKALAAPTPAPPPVRMNSAEVDATKNEQRRRQAMRQGYAATLLAPATPGAEQKKTLLGG